MGHLGVTQLAKALGVSRQSVYRAEGSGHIVREADGKFDLERARADWLKRSRMQMGGIHSRMNEGPLAQDPHRQHPVLTIMQQTWARSLRSMALCLRELETFPESERHFVCLASMFLLQWRIVGNDLGPPWDQWEESPLEMTGDMCTLIQPGGGEELERWLKKQERLNIREE